MEASQPVKDASITALADALDSDTIGPAEPLIIAAWGIILGFAAGHLAALSIAARLHEASAIAIMATCMIEELMVAGAVLLLAAVAGLIPAIASYRQDVATNLAPA